MPQLTTVTPAARAAFAALLGALGAFACNHTEPFVSPPNDTDQPFDPSPPIQLTINAGADRAPTWLPDGSGILYAAHQIARSDLDLCLALLPPTGGRQRELWCDVPGGRDLTDAIESAAPAPDGRLGFVAASSSIRGNVPSLMTIALAPILDPTKGQTVRTLPYTPVGGEPQRRIGQLHWLGENRLVYLGLTVEIRSPCQRCELDTISTGLAATVFDASQPGSIPTVIPGTELASSVTPAGGDAVLYTLGGDTRIFRRVLTTGEVTTVHDFGAAGITRDVHAVGNRVVAVVGGRVAFAIDPLLGPAQRDSGGVVHVVDLDSGIDLALEDVARLYRRPALSPAGDQIVVEGYPLIITPGSPDTTVGKSPDLYLFGAP
ncbi:MAG: TolB family protein [Gemmatimonadales bacterium]